MKNPTNRHILFVLFSVITLSACGDDAFRRYDAAVLALEDGRNQAAMTEAKYAARALSGQQRLRACYIAGVSATRLGNFNEAMRYLEQSKRSNERLISGNSYMEIAFIQLEKNEPQKAGESYENAGSRLRGDDSVRAYTYGVEAYRNAGLTAEAARLLSRIDTTQFNDEDSVIGNLSRNTGYTIQFGSYRTKTNADTRAQQIASSTRGSRMGEVKIRKVNGLWKVQLGVFPNRREASQAMKRLSRSDAVIMEIGK